LGEAGTTRFDGLARYANCTLPQILSCGARQNFGLLACDKLATEPALNLLKLLTANVEFSRHAARKLRIARYRRMPHGRLEFLVWHHHAEAYAS
jgi:hypothetical protein